jgi:translation initiation factor IF-3
MKKNRTYRINVRLNSDEVKMLGKTMKRMGNVPASMALRILLVEYYQAQDVYGMGGTI